MNKFIEIEKYIKKSRDERRSHLDLGTDCIEIGGDSREFRSHLAFYLGTTLPSGHLAYLCHACNNSRCANPKHHYWGTPKDNAYDQIEAGNRVSPWESMVKKFGIEKSKQMMSENAKKAGHAGGGSNKIKSSLIEKRREGILKIDPQSYGWVTRASKELGLSHSQIKRFVDEHMQDVQVYRRSKKKQKIF